MIAFGPKKDGSPNVKYFESAETLAALEIVKQWLHKTVKKVRSDCVWVSVVNIVIITVSSTRTPYEQKPVFTDSTIFAISRRQFRKKCPKASHDQNTGNKSIKSVDIQLKNYYYYVGEVFHGFQTWRSTVSHVGNSLQI